MNDKSKTPNYQPGEGRFIYVISDGTGETASNLIRSLITQFKDANRHIFIRRYPKVKDKASIDQILTNARNNEDPVMVAYTLVNASERDYVKEKLKEYKLLGYDLFSSLLSRLSHFLGASPAEAPDEFHGINEKYFSRMEAIEFTLNHDDGKNLRDLDDADVILVGLSRTGKTPLSIYLSLYGLKVVNVPLAKGVAPPKELDNVPQNKVVCLTIDPTRLLEIRKRRLTGLNVGESRYSDPNEILDEVEEADRFFRRHRVWPVIDVTTRSIEETAALVREKVFGRDRPLV